MSLHNTADAHAELANRFFNGIENGDVATVRDCYHPDVQVWLNTAGVAKNRDENLAVLSGLVAKTSSRRYLDRRIIVTPDGFVQQHVLNAEHLKGPVLNLPAALVCAVKDSRIVRIDEYFDSAHLLAWYAAIEAAS